MVESNFPKLAFQAKNKMKNQDMTNCRTKHEVLYTFLILVHAKQEEDLKHEKQVFSFLVLKTVVAFIIFRTLFDFYCINTHHHHLWCVSFIITPLMYGLTRAFVQLYLIILSSVLEAKSQVHYSGYWLSIRCYVTVFFHGLKHINSSGAS